MKVSSRLQKNCCLKSLQEKFSIGKNKRIEKISRVWEEVRKRKKIHLEVLLCKLIRLILLYLLLSVACNSNLSLEENYWDHNCVIHTEDFRGSHDHLYSDLHSHHNGSYLSNKIVFVGLFHCMQTAFYSNLYPWESLHRNCLSHKSSRRYSDCHLHSYLAGGHTKCQ